MEAVACEQNVALCYKCGNVNKLYVKTDMCPAHALNKYGGYNVTNMAVPAIDKQQFCHLSHNRTACLSLSI